MENYFMFIIGTFIFGLYMVGYLIMVRKQNMIQKQKSIQGESLQTRTDTLDSDGHGNWGRFPKSKTKTKIIKISNRL